MATETITLRLVAQDLMSGNVSKAIGGLDKLAKRGGLVGSVLQGVGQSMGQLLNPVGLVADGIGSVVTALGDAQTAYRQDQLSQTQLRAALQANVAAWDGNTEAIENVIAARMELGFSDDEQRASLALLVAQVKDVNDALAIQRTAMDFARLKGISLADASTALAKAYNGSAGGLQRMGIQISRGTKGMAALGEVQKRVAGQAEAWADTSTGAAEAFNVKVGELQEKLGAFVDGAGRGFIQFLSGVVDVLDGPEGANKMAHDLAAEIRAIHDAAGQTGGMTPLQVFERDLQRTRDQMAQLQYAVPENAFAWIQELGPRAIMASGATVDALADIAISIQQTGGTITDFWIAVGKLSQNGAKNIDFVSGAWTGSMKSIKHETQKTAQTVPGIAWNIPMGVVDKLREGIPSVRSVMKDLRWAIEHPLAGAKNRARILGALTSQRLIEGINSKNPDVRQAAIDARAELLRQWNALPGKALELGRVTIKELVRGLNEGEQYALGLYGQTGTESGDRRVRRNRRRGHRPRRAGGGQVMGGQTYLVGENGPEELYLSAGSGGYVTPNHQLGNGGAPIHVHFHGVVAAPSEAEGQRLARIMAPHLDRHRARVPA